MTQDTLFRNAGDEKKQNGRCLQMSQGKKIKRQIERSSHLPI